MNDQKFKQIRKEFDELATKELDDRGPSYAEDADRLANFKALGKELGMSSMQVLMVYLKKHMRSIERYVRDGHQTSEGIITNFVGARNYLDLAAALMKDLSSNSNEINSEWRGQSKSHVHNFKFRLCECGLIED